MLLHRAAGSPLVQGIGTFLVGTALLFYGTFLARQPQRLNMHHWQQHAPVGALFLLAAGFFVAAVGSSRARAVLDDEIDRSLLPVVLAAVTVVCALILWA